MAVKKDRGRFTLRLNEKDPAHAEVIRLLEQQDPHSKGRFIVNAILHYVHCSETPDFSVQQSLNRPAVEEMILDILKEQRIAIKEEESPPRLESQTEVPEKIIPCLKQEQEKEAAGKDNMDDGTRALIQNTLLAFRSNS